MLGDVCGRVVWGESEVLCLPTDQDEAEVHLRQKRAHLSSEKRSAAHQEHQTSITVISVGWGGIPALPLTSFDMR